MVTIAMDVLSEWEISEAEQSGNPYYRIDVRRVRVVDQIVQYHYRHAEAAARAIVIAAANEPNRNVAVVIAFSRIVDFPVDVFTFGIEKEVF